MLFWVIVMVDLVLHCFLSTFSFLQETNYLQVQLVVVYIHDVFVRLSETWAKSLPTYNCFPHHAMQDDEALIEDDDGEDEVDILIMELTD